MPRGDVLARPRATMDLGPAASAGDGALDDGTEAVHTAAQQCPRGRTCYGTSRCTVPAPGRQCRRLPPVWRAGGTAWYLALICGAVLLGVAEAYRCECWTVRL